MPYRFFFSYARDDDDEYLQHFLKDLSRRIRQQLGGVGKNEAVGFFDQPDIPLGADWEARLIEALQACPVMVSVYSPAYFNSTNCGKEWEVFRRRRELFVRNAVAAGGNQVDPPPVIKPVIWIPLLEEHQRRPEAVGDMQYYMGNPQADHNKVGLQAMLRLKNEYDVGYENFLQALKNQIIAAQNFNLPRLPDFTRLEQIESAFHKNGNEGDLPPPPTPAPHPGPQFVRFVCVAAKPEEFPGGVPPREPYLTHGGPDWRPYYPDAPTKIFLLAQKTAAGMGIFSDQLPFSKTLPTDVREAEDQGSLVVLLVDSWTAELPRYQSILKDFDKHSYFNCSIFIPSNEKDEQNAAKREALLEFVRNNIFRRWSLLAKSGLPYFRDSIGSASALERQLKRVVQQLQTQVAKGVLDRSTKDTIPRGIQTDIPRPMMSHKST